MESDEGHVEAQGESKGDEAVVNEETTVERPDIEVDGEIPGLLPETSVGQKVEDLVGASQITAAEDTGKEDVALASGELMGPDQDAFGDLAKLNQGEVGDAQEGEMALGIAGEKVEEVIELGLGKAEDLERLDLGEPELKSSGETGEVKESGEPNLEETIVFGSPDEGGAERKTGEGIDQWEKKECVHVKEKMVGEGEMVLEVGEREVVELAEPNHGEKMDLVKEAHAHAEESSEKGDERKLIGLDERDVEETTEREDVAMGVAEEMPELDQKEMEGESGKEADESAEHLGEVEVLSGPGQGEVTGEEEDVASTVDQGETEEVPGVDEREREEVTAEEGAVLAMDQRETEELVGLGQEEVEVLTGEKGSALDEGKAEMLAGPGEEGFNEAMEREIMAPGADQREAEEDTPSAGGQGEVEDLVRVSRGEREEVAPAVDQGKAEVLGEDVREAEEVSAKGEAVVAEKETEHLVEGSQRDVEEKGVASALDQEKAEEAPETNEKETEEVTPEEEVASVTDQKVVADLAGASQGETEEGMAPVVEQVEAKRVPGEEQMEAEVVTVMGDVAEGLVVTEKVPGEEQMEAEVVTVMGDVAEGLVVTERVPEEQMEAEVVTAMGDVAEGLVVTEKVPGEEQMEAEVVTAMGDVAEGLVVTEKVPGEEQMEAVVVTVMGDVAEGLVVTEKVPGEEQMEAEVVTVMGDVAEGLVVTEKVPGEEQMEAEVVTVMGDVAEGLVVTEKVPGEEQMEAEVVTAMGDVAEGLVVTSLGETVEVTGKEDTPLVVGGGVAEEVLGADERKVDGEMELTVWQGEAREVVGAPRALEETGGQEEIPVQSQEKGAKEEMRLGTSQEKVGELTGPEQMVTKDLIGLGQGEAEQLGSARMVVKEETREEEEALAVDQGEAKEWARSYQGQTAEGTGGDEKALSQYQQDAMERKVPSREKTLAWSPEVEEHLGGPTQEMAGVPSGEGIHRLGQRAKPSQDEAAALARVGWRASDLGLGRGHIEAQLTGSSLRVSEELDRSGSSVMSSHLLQRSAIGSPKQIHREKGKRISGLAGLRQGPILVAHRGATRSAGARHGVLEHIAPGLIVTSLTAQAEQRGLIKQARTQQKVGVLEQRETRSAELGSHETRIKVGEPVVLMGYRIGREGMSCFSEAENRTGDFQQVPVMEEAGKRPDEGQAEPPRLEQDVRESKILTNGADDIARQRLEEMHLSWLGRPLSRDYAITRPSSGWTAGIGPGHGLTLGSLRAGITERINMMVVGQGATKSAGQSPEPSPSRLGRRVFGLTSRSADVHWLKEVLGSGQTVSRLSVAGHASSSKEGSPVLMTERRSPGLLTGKQELKDWRDGVMGIAIKRYNAMRLAMWGEGPVGLHVKGMKVAGGSEGVSMGTAKTSSILGQVERKVLRLAQHVKSETVSGLEVEGQGLADRLKQDMEPAGSGQGSRITRSSLLQESETLEVQPDKQEEFSAHTANSETGSPERRLGCQGTQELDGSSQWLADQNEAGSQHALEQEANTTTTNEVIGTRGKEQERIKMQSSSPRQHHALHTQTASDRMTGSNPVSPASSGSPASTGSISPPHLTHDSSLDSHLGFDVPKTHNRALVSPGMYTSPDPASMWDKTHAEIAEQAKHEAEIENRIAEMKKEGFWSLKRLLKVPEPVRPKVHWDYLCEEMQWLSADFAQERRWKRGVARKVVRMVIRHHEEQKQKEERAKREEQAKLRRIASSIAKEVKQFWSNVEKVVQFKQQSRLEEKRKKALDLQLDFIVGQTEKYSDLLSQSLNKTFPVSSKTSGSHAGSTASSPPPSHLTEDEADGDFQPHEESDDEETIEVEEQQEGNDSETRQREIELLKQEGELPLEELLQSLPPQILENSFNVSPCASSSDNDEEEEGDSEEEEEQEENQTSRNLKEKPKSLTQRNKKPWKPDEEDEEFTANEEEAEDEEETIAAEEKLEGDVDHSQELDDLTKEGELPMEELLQKYAGAYASDFEMEESDTSSEVLEPSTSEYEEESEEEDTSSQSDSTEEVESEQDESEEEDAMEGEEEEASVSQEEDFGVEYLLKQDEDRGGEGDNDSTPAPGPKKEITDIAAAAESLQPKGYTLATTQVKTPIPYLLRGTLREYQHIGLDWLVTMYEKKLNGILADEMGLGKTIQTISLLAHLACEKGSWGPHLIIVPTSVMLNWEMEIKRWCPSFKILTYYGAQKERKLKRQDFKMRKLQSLVGQKMKMLFLQLLLLSWTHWPCSHTMGWTKPNAFHICITSYKLVLQDHQAFRRKNWKYLILDEAQNIKNFKSQRWQSLLNFNSQRRLLLTGTPLQNSLMELWSLMHFLMPHVFQSHREFKEWFSNPLTGMIEGSQEYNENLVKRLHKVLRPFLLRRVKVDVEKQMPKKYEHVIKCRLSKRQRYLYDDFMAQATTKETLATGHFMSVINILMQLRKVCNHPNLFDPRPIHSPFITEGICFNTASLILHALDNDPFKHLDLGIFDLINLEGRVSRYETDTFLPKWKVTRKLIEEIAESPDPPPRPKPVKMKVNRMLQPMPKPENRTVVLVNSPRPTTPLQRPIAPMLPETLTPALASLQHPGPVLPGPVQPPTLPVSVSLPMPIPMPPSPVTMSIPVPPPIRPQTQTLVPTLSQNNTTALLQGHASTPQVLPMAMTAAQLVPNSPRPLLPPSPISSTTTASSSLKPGSLPGPGGQQQQQPMNPLAIASLGQQPSVNTQPINSLGASSVGQQQPINTVGMSPMGQLPPPSPANTLGPAPPAQQSTSTMGTGTIGGMMKPMNIHSAVPTLPGYNFTTAGALQQRLLLSPDMQARLPSGEVVSIGQLASLANRPLQSAPGSKPLTFQIQGNKLTLTGPQVRQVTVPQPARQLPRNVVHLVSAGGQHHIISQPAQVALIQAMAQQAGQAPVGVQAVPGHQPPTVLPVPATSTAAAAVASTATISVPIAATQVPSSAVNSSGVVKIVVRQAPRDGLLSPSPGPQQPPLRPVTPTTAATLPGLSAALMAQRAPLPMNPVPPVRLPAQPLVPVRAPTPATLQALVRPMLRMVPAPSPSTGQQLVAASTPPTVASFAVTPAATVTVAANPSPAMASQTTSSPVPKEEPEMLTLRSTTPTPPPPPSILAPRPRRQPPPPPRSPFYLESLEEKRKKQKEERLDRLFRLNEQHCHLVPIYGTEVLRFCTLFPPAPPSWSGEEEESEERVAAAAQEVEPKLCRGSGYAHCYAAQVQRDPHRLEAYWQRAETLAQAILTPQQRIEELTDIIERFIFVMPPVEAPAITMHTSHPPPSLLLQQAVFKQTLQQELSPHASGLHRIVCNMRTQFPDLRLIQYDCGKLQTLDHLLRHLKTGAHRVLIFTQMTRMLDVLEQFLNYHGHIYLRLDGSTRVEQRQALMERFNADKRIFCFILSTRSGGVGVNLTGADTVVFYDSDWNPTMDAQAQDRCHRIGQTRDVHIYRLISERTVEENILKKANQKRMLGDMAIEGGNFTTAYFKQQTIRELFDMPLDEPAKKEGEALALAQEDEEDPMATKQTQILEQALCRAEDPEDIRAATQAKAEQVAELAEFNENIPLDTEDRPSKEEEEEMSKAEQEIASLVEQLTPIERYAMNFLEASLEDISREELKQAEEQVEAARKDIDQAKDEVVFKLPEDEDESCLLEEGSSKKSKKAKVLSRTASERTGTRMSERLRSTRLLPRDGDNGDVESPQTRLPNLRHSRVVTDEEDDSLPQVAQHTRGAAVRRELVREEKPAQVILHTRRTLPRREEPWTKASPTGERMQKTAPHRTEASADRVLRNNPHRTETLPVGEKLQQVSPHKADLGAAGDRVLRGTLPRTEAQPAGDRLPRSAPQRTDTGLDKMVRPGPQKPEKPSELDKLPSSPRTEIPIYEAQLLQLHPQALDGEMLNLKTDIKEQKEEEITLVTPSVPEFQVSKNILNAEVPAFQAQDLLVADEKLLSVQSPAGAEKAEIPATKEKASSPATLIASVERPYERKPEVACEVGLPWNEQKESLPRSEEEADVSATCSTAKQQESLNSVHEAHEQEVAQEMVPSRAPDRTVSETLISKTSEGIPLESTLSAVSRLGSETPTIEVPVLPSLDHSMPAVSSLVQLETLSCVKEPNGLEQPPRTGDFTHPTSSFLDEPQPKISLPEIVLPTLEAASCETNSLKESPKQSQGIVGKKLHEDEQQNKEAETTATCPGSVSSQESPPGTVICSGGLSPDESLSPIKPPRRRTSADVQIRQSCQDQDGPAAKVLRKLPGRLVTVVEEKELIRRRRNRVRKLDAANSIMMSPSNSSAQSVSEPETSPGGKELPLLRDLPARRRIELETRAAAREREDGSRGELLISPSVEPMKRKRGRPPKNKSPEQQSPGLLQPLPEPFMETNPQSWAPEMKVLEINRSKTPEKKGPEIRPQSKIPEKIQPQSKTTEKVPEIQPQRKIPEKKVPKTTSPKIESPKNKTESSKNNSPVEKRRRGRPPKIRESSTMSPKSSNSGILPAPSTKPLITELLPKVQEQLDKSPRPTSVTETTSKIHKSLDMHPKTTSISKISPKARNQMSGHPKPISVMKSTPKARELLATEVHEPLPPTPPRAVSAAEVSPEMQGLPCPTALGSTTSDSPPKRKRGRPPKNQPSPRVEAAPPPTSASDHETSTEKQTPVPPVRKRRRRRRKDELGPALPGINQSSSEGEDSRPLTRLALLKREEKPEACSEGFAQPSPKHVVAEGASSAESTTWEQPSSDTPTRSTRLRPGSLVPPLERETQRRKRRCSLEGSRVSNSSKSPAPQATSEQEGGESESSLRSSSESSSNKRAQQPKRQCYESAGGRGRGRGRHHGSMADRILRSAAKPTDNTRSASSPIPTRKMGPPSFSTSAGGATGVLSPSAAPSPAAPVTSSLSNRGRKPKT